MAAAEGSDARVVMKLVKGKFNGFLRLGTRLSQKRKRVRFDVSMLRLTQRKTNLRTNPRTNPKTNPRSQNKSHNQSQS